MNLDDNDVDDVVNNNQQLCEFPTIPTQVSLDTHQRFSEYLQSKYGDEKDIFLNKHKELDYVFTLGIEKAKEKLQFEIYPLLFEGKPPRADVMKKLVTIAKEFQSYPDYPIIKSMTITNIIDRVMDSKDKRTKRKYHKCIEKYVGEPKELGKTDVSGFIERIPNEFLNTTSSTSSFIEGDLDNEL